MGVSNSYNRRPEGILRVVGGKRSSRIGLLSFRFGLEPDGTKEQLLDLNQPSFARRHEIAKSECSLVIARLNCSEDSPRSLSSFTRTDAVRNWAELAHIWSTNAVKEIACMLIDRPSCSPRRCDHHSTYEDMNPGW